MRLRTLATAGGVAAIAALAVVACRTPPAPMPVVERVNLPRFMGDWYVIACIPTFIERDAYNAVESYVLDEDERIATTFTFRAGGFDGPRKRYHPTGFVRDKSGALWGMQFIWPIKADYRVLFLDEGYTQTIIGRLKRDHAWIMARRPQIAEDDYARHVQFLREQGYDVSKLRRVPQQPEGERASAER